jgi:DNA-directed RNA polymerase subunit K/omega
MESANESVELQESRAPQEPVAPITNRFLFVDVAALRAKQLRRGAVPRLSPPFADPVTGHRPELPRKAERIAMEEVKTGMVPYEVLAAKEGMETA